MRLLIAVLLALIAVGCTGEYNDSTGMRTLARASYWDKVHGAWQATVVANHTGLDLQGVYLDEPGPEQPLDLKLLEEWSTDDDTHVEWVDLHILETYGLEPTYEQIRDEWVDHLNNDIWVSALRARQLMDRGYIPPATGDPRLNPVGVWSIGAQLQTEVFGLIAPGMPHEASRRAVYFARVTNSGLAVDASAFYTHMYAEAFFETEVSTLVARAQRQFPAGARINRIVEYVRLWHRRHPDDWRATRQEIRDAYDHDPHWWASQVNFAATIMALLYGQGDLMRTMNIAARAGWDADNNMATSAGLLGVVIGFEGLPAPIRTSSDVYFNQDVTGDLPERDTISNIVRRTRKLAEEAIVHAGGRVENGVYLIPVGK